MITYLAASGYISHKFFEEHLEAIEVALAGIGETK